MYNLNVNLATSATTLAVESACTTPKTPEILNSLIAMTNPFDNCYPNSIVGGNVNHHITTGGHTPRVASSPPEHSSGAMVGSPSYSTAPSPGKPCSSPRSSMVMHSPPSVQHTCSQLIKEGLKLTIQTKRRQSKTEPVNLPSTASIDTDGDDIYGDSSPSSVDSKAPRREEVGADLPASRRNRLTAEDEERRRRRRERNKIAATKCRLKKRERTVNLVQESEILENQNHEMKSQIQELENQRRRLLDMLSIHSPTCVKNGGDGRNSSRVINEGLYPSSSSAASSSSSISSVSSSSIPTSSPNSSSSSLSASSIPASSPSLVVDPTNGGMPPTPPGPPAASATPAPYDYEGIPGGEYHVLHRQINHDTHHIPHTQHSQQLSGHHMSNQSQLQHQQHLVEGW